MTQKDDFDIVSLIELCRERKYETCVAGFQILDKIDKISVPKKLKTRKLTVQTLYSLSSDEVQYKYLSKDEKDKIKEEKERLSGSTSLQGTSFAPHAEEDIEEDFIPEEEEKTETSEEDEDGFDDDEDDEEEDDFDDAEEEEEED